MKTIRSKILFAVVSLMVVTLLAVLVVTEKNFETELERLQKRLIRGELESAMYLVEREYDKLVTHELDSIERRRELMKNVSAVVLSHIGERYGLGASGQIDEDAAKKSALAWISGLRYGNNQYFFACDGNLSGLVHPDEQMIGKKWTGHADIKLKDAFPQLLETVRNEKTADTVFHWPDINSKLPVKQMGHFCYFPPWDWMIGTTVGIGDIEEESLRRIHLVLENLEKIFRGGGFANTGHVFIFDGTGRVLVHPESGPITLPGVSENTGSAFFDSLRDAAKNPSAPIVHTSFPFGNRRSEATIFVDYFKPTDWYVAAFISSAEVSDPVENLIARQALIILAILAVGIAVAIYLSGRTAKPILMLARYARGLPEKDFTKPNRRSDFDFGKMPDEVSQLTESFVFMETELRKLMGNLAWESGINSAFAGVSKALIESKSVEEISGIVLEETKRLTNSQFGYVGFIDLETGHLVVPTLTGDVWEQCRMEGKRAIFKIFEGLCGWVLTNRKPVLTNSAADDPRAAGTPTGHVPIRQFLSVPAMIEDTLVGQIAVANPGRDFTEQDMRLVGRMATLFALAVQRKQMENALKRSHNELERRVRQRTVELSAKNERLKMEMGIRIEAERALRKSEEKFRRLVESTADWVWATDTDGHFTYSNAAVRDFLDYEISDIMGVPAFSLMHPEDTWFVQNLLKEAREKQTGWKNLTVRRLHKDGSVKHIESTAQPIVDEHGRVSGFAGIDRDITERKNTQTRLENAMLAAESANKAKGEFLAMMSHELRTPLNAILGYARVLYRDDAKSDRLKGAFDIILKNGEHLLEMIDEILDLSKIEAKKTELETSCFSLDDFLEELVETVRIRADEKDIGFVCEKAPNLPNHVRADRKRLRQVLSNLLDNAVKYTENGRVTFKIYLLEPRKFLFRVEDTGIGIAPEKLESVFLPFYRVADNRYPTGGTGLGLAISHEILKLMNAELRVKSEPGVGSAFWFQLDMPEANGNVKSHKRLGANRVIGYEGDRRKILIVDDIADNRAVLREILLPLGFELDEAVDGFEALKKVDTFRPHLILLDLIMPKLNGFETLRMVREDAKPPQPVVIVISANVTIAAKMECLRNGCDDFVSKPVEITELLDKIHQHVRTKWLFEKV